MTFTEYLSNKYNFNLEVERSSYFTMLETNRRSTKDEIGFAVEQMAALSGYRFNQIMARTRKSEIIAIRHVMIYLINKNFNLSFREIGYLFGNIDHSTVIHAKDKIGDLLEIGDKATIEMHQRLKVVFDEKTN